MSILFYKVFCSKSTWIRCNICSDSTWSKSLLFTDYSNPEGAGPTQTTVLTSHWRSHLHIHKTRDITGTADKLSTCPCPCQSVDLCPNPSRHMQWPPSNPLRQMFNTPPAHLLLHIRILRSIFANLASKLTLDLKSRFVTRFYIFFTPKS